METIAVITGDIVASRKIPERNQLSKTLKSLFQTIDKKATKSIGAFEIYRGDSFQGIIKDPAKALLVAILIRARLRSSSFSIASKETSSQKKPLHNFSDARISIGIGEVSYKSRKIIESDGEAFRYSGELLDKMKKSNSELAIQTPWKEVNEELAVSFKLLDSLIGKWTSASAEVIYLHFLNGYSQHELSNQLGISQPAVHKRLILANLDAIAAIMNRFEQLIFKHIK